MSDQVMREALKNLAEGARRRGFNASSGFTTETEGGKCWQAQTLPDSQFLRGGR